MYRVLKLFADLEDNNHTYKPGDIYPRKGLEPTAERIAELSGSNNKQGCPLIEKILDATEKKTTKKAKDTAAK